MRLADILLCRVTHTAVPSPVIGQAQTQSACICVVALLVCSAVVIALHSRRKLLRNKQKMQQK